MNAEPAEDPRVRVAIVDDHESVRLGVAAAIALVFALSAIFFRGDQLEFLQEQNGRGLQIEAVATLPWHLREVVDGSAPNAVSRFGATEIASGPADTVADLLKWAALAVLIGAAVNAAFDTVFPQSTTTTARLTRRVD